MAFLSSKLGRFKQIQRLQAAFMTFGNAKETNKKLGGEQNCYIIQGL